MSSPYTSALLPLNVTEDKIDGSICCQWIAPPYFSALFYLKSELSILRKQLLSLLKQSKNIAPPDPWCKGFKLDVEKFALLLKKTQS